MSQSQKITIGYFLTFISLGLTVSALGPTLPSLAVQTGTSLSGISLLFVARNLGFMAGALLFGRLYDRLPGHRLMVLSLMFISLSMAVVPLVPALWLLTLVICCLGFFQPGLDVGGNTLLVWLYQERVGAFMNGLHFFFGIGAFITPMVVAWAIATSDGVRPAFWVLAFLIFLPALYLVRQPSPTMPSSMSAANGGPTNKGLVLLIALFFFLYVGAEVSFGGWIFTYVTARGLATAESAATLTSLFWGALMVGRLLAILIARRLRNRAIIFGDLLGSVASVTLLLLWSHLPAAIWLGTILLGLSMASVFPTTLSLAERHLHVRGRTTSYFFIGASLGGMIIPWLVGQLFETVGPTSVLVTVLLALLAAALVFAFLLQQITHRQPAPAESFLR